MAERPGGEMILAYSNGSESYELRLHVAPFDHSTFAYTGTGPTHPLETGIGDTFSNFGTIWGRYYDASWALELRSIWAFGAPDGAMLPTLPPVPPQAGLAGTGAVMDPLLRRGFSFLTALGGRHRLRLFHVATNEIGSARTVFAGSGGFDARDQALVAYVSGSATGLVTWDGYGFPSQAYCYIRFHKPSLIAGAGGGTSGGTVGFTGDCLAWPLGGRICNPLTDVMTLSTGPGSGAGVFSFDDTGITLPGGHRLEVV